ncbi:uncharacterized protein LTR77_003594 [Saxophila tyrrhenica]|uniref:Heterokaryon incompatibility domain-containing protein n=1 Tax=Saxophila tyrrhenica TaxID=1690608 RepID=A0AAV9PI29_9PEZI|nr:hypothetical protein LTR77_003594 [Saxophila tyrrhenica]
MRRADRVRTLWIDSLCTNQEDTKEREQQVRLMRKVYSLGQGNLIHLGPGSVRLYQAMGDINTILNSLLAPTGEKEVEETDPDAGAPSPAVGTTVPRLADCTCLEEFFDLPYVSLLVPDYSKSTRNVLRDASRFALSRDHCRVSDVLREVSLSPEDLGTAEQISWVPSWQRRWDFDVDPVSFGKGLFNADGGILSDLDSSNSAQEALADADILELTGLVHDWIQSDIGPTLTTDARYNFVQLKTWLEKTLKLISASLPPIVVASVLLAETNWALQRATAQELAEWTYLEAWMAHNDIHPPSLYDLTDDTPPPDAAAMRSFFALGMACVNRRAFRTASGYVGLGPQVMREGDLVVILIGCETPYVLRPHVNGTYRLLGHCYVYGVMDGEAMREHRRRWDADQVFRLC